MRTPSSRNTRGAYRHVLNTSVATAVAAGLIGASATTGAVSAQPDPAAESAAESVTESGAEVSSQTPPEGLSPEAVRDVADRAARAYAALEAAADPIAPNARGLESVSDFDFTKFGTALAGSHTDVSPGKAVADQIVSPILPSATLLSTGDVTPEVRGEPAADQDAALAKANDETADGDVVPANTLRGTWSIDIDDLIDKYGSSLVDTHEDFMAMVELPANVDQSTLTLTRLRDNKVMDTGFASEGGEQVLSFNAKRGEMYTLTADLKDHTATFAPAILGSVIPVNNEIDSTFFFTLRSDDPNNQGVTPTSTMRSASSAQTSHTATSAQPTVEASATQMPTIDAPVDNTQPQPNPVLPPSVEAPRDYKGELSHLLDSLGYTVNDQGNLVISYDGKPVNWNDSAIAIEGMRLAAVVEGAVLGEVEFAEIAPTAATHIANIAQAVKDNVGAGTVTVTVTAGAQPGNQYPQPQPQPGAGRQPAAPVVVEIDPATGNVRVIKSGSQPGNTQPGTGQPEGTQPGNTQPGNTGGNQGGNQGGGTQTPQPSGAQTTVTVTPTPTVTVTADKTTTSTTATTSTTKSELKEVSEIITLLSGLMGGTALAGKGGSGIYPTYPQYGPGAEATTTASNTAVNDGTKTTAATDAMRSRPENNGVRTMYDENGNRIGEVYFADGTATTSTTGGTDSVTYGSSQAAPVADDGSYGVSDADTDGYSQSGSTGGGDDYAARYGETTDEFVDGTSYRDDDYSVSGETYDDGFDPYEDYNGDGVVDEADYDAYYNNAASGSLPVTGSQSRTVGVLAGLSLLAAIVLGGWFMVRNRDEA